MRTKQMQLGKQRTKQVEERWCHQGRSPRVCLPFSQTSCGSSPSLEALSWCETPFSTWSSPQKTKRRPARKGETDRQIRRGQEVREEEECKQEVRTQKGPQVMGQRSRETGGNLGEGWKPTLSWPGF